MDVLARLKSASALRAAPLALLLVVAPAGLVRAESDGASAAGGPDLGELSLHWSRGTDRYAEEVAAARQGDCGPLLDAVRMGDLPDLTATDIPAEDEAARLIMALEMADRGLCVEADPALGTRILARLAAPGPERKQTIGDYPFFHWDMRLDQAWRAWHGFGRPQDRAEAKDLIETALLDGAFGYDGRSFERRSRLSFLRRLLPAYAQEVARQIQAAIEGEDLRIRFALDLIHGGPLLRRISGDVPARLPTEGAALLDRMDDSMRARYELAQAALSGHLDEHYKTTPSVQLRVAAICGYMPAIQAILKFDYESGTHNAAVAYPANAMAMLWFLEDQGFDTIAYIREIAERHDMPGSRDAYETYIASLEETLRRSC